MRVICIDSFKLEYLEYAPYLKSLTEKYQYGELKVPVGFEGGMEKFFKGKSDILAMFYKSENSSLKWTKHISFLPRIALDILINLQRLFKNNRRFFRTYKIPKNKLHYFETSINKTPWQFTDFDYKLISELDKIAHKYGTKSEEVKDCIRELDEKLKNEDFDIVMSDHGMIDVKEAIKVPVNDDCFIDSTMARYWGECPELPLNKGKIIKVDKKWGDYVFLANPGVLICPSYFSKNPVKAMHGYDSNCEGFYITKKEGKKKDLTMQHLHYEAGIHI